MLKKRIKIVKLDRININKIQKKICNKNLKLTKI